MPPSATKPRSRAHIHTPATPGERIADAVAALMGSWRFIITQSVIVGVWILLNVWLLSHPFDPYPLILLNLLFSTQAAYAAPIIMMSQNRQAAKDRRRDDHEADEVEQLFAINQQQLEILRLLHTLAAVQPLQPTPTPAATPPASLDSDAPQPPDAPTIARRPARTRARTSEK